MNERCAHRPGVVNKDTTFWAIIFSLPTDVDGQRSPHTISVVKRTNGGV